MRREIENAVARFGRCDPLELGWLTIDLGEIVDVPRQCVRATNRLRNTLDNERRRREHWDDVEVRALFRSVGSHLTVSGFVYLGNVAPPELSRVLQNAWAVEAVSLTPFSGENAEAAIRAFGARWQTGPEVALPSFRRMRLTVGRRWMKATRHWSPLTNEPDYLEPMPISVGYDGAWL